MFNLIKKRNLKIQKINSNLKNVLIKSAIDGAGSGK